MRRGDRDHESIRVGVAIEPIKSIYATKADRMTPLVHNYNVRPVCLVPD